MILQALNVYYNRLREDPESGIALPGFAPQKISFAVVINREGRLMEIQDIRDTSGKKPRPIAVMLPEAVIRTVGVASNFMWDNTGYVLGLDNKGKPERTRECFEAFRKLHHEIGDGSKDAGMIAMLSFLDSWKPSKPPKSLDWEEIVGSNLVFRLARDRGFVHQRPAIVAVWGKRKTTATALKRTCLVTGENAPIAPLHAKIKGVKDAQSTGAAIISFNLDAFRSFGKDQNYNAPVGEQAAFAYTTALNHLLRFESKQKLQIGDATTVFWTEGASFVEDYLGYILDPRQDAAVSAAEAKKIADYLKAVRSGKMPDLIKDGSMQFHILGLAPNASRLAVRFWYTDSVEAFSRHLGRHFADLHIAKEFDNQVDYPGIWQLLIETAPLRKSDNINPKLAGALMRSILQPVPYPAFLLAAVIDRIRADHNVNYYRAALIKAVLRRNHAREDIAMALDEESKDVAYRLGRLFAVLEKAQKDVMPELNATIKDRFFSSASATPRVVFPQLVRLSQHHLAKDDNRGRKINRDKLIQAILDGIEADKGFPAHLTLEDQGMFTLGYYHQRKALFTSKESDEAEEK
jgi:CRISPR-associated protein Csd1